MKHYRYGRFRFNDYISSWLAITVLISFSIISIVLKLSMVLVLFPMIFAVIWMLTIIVPQCERFTICKDCINVWKGKKVHEIPLPQELILVISYADICPPFTVRTAIREQTHILRGKYAVSILREMPLETVLEALHRNHLQVYTTSTIRRALDDCNYIYSFVCDQCLLDALLSYRNCQLIVPESLLGGLSIDPSFAEIFIDANC